MTLFIISFLAGVLTVLAPCILPLLPIIVGGSVSEGKRDPYKAYVITGSLALSIILFTLLLKFSTALIDIPQEVWKGISGSILIGFGLVMLFPRVWELFANKIHLGRSSNKLLAEGTLKKSRWGDVMIGAALGPVFSTCSPTYFVILATVLPASFGVGLLYLIAYASGLSLILLAISLLGQKLVGKLNVAANPDGWFKRGMGILFLAVGLLIMFGGDKAIETFLIDRGIFDVTQIENRLLETIE